MGTLQLPQGTRAVVQYAGPRPEATFIAWVMLESRSAGTYRQEVVGCIALHPNDLTDRHGQFARWKRRLAMCTTLGWTLRSVTIEAFTKEYRPMTDLQRFRRKMGMVLRAYEEEKAKALRGELGLPEMAMERLELELQESWTKAERIYGCRREDFYQPTN